MPTPQHALIGHGSQTPYACAAQQTEQQGFGLIIAMLPRQQHLALNQPLTEGAVTRLPGSLLETCSGLNLNANRLECHPERLADLLTMLWPAIGSSLQTVVHMDGVERRQGFATGEFSQKMQKHSRVEAAGETDMPDRRIAPWGQDLKKPGRKIMTGA